MESRGHQVLCNPLWLRGLSEIRRGICWEAVIDHVEMAGAWGATLSVNHGQREPWKGGHLQMMGHQDDGLPSEHLLKALLKDILPHVGVQGREWVVQQVELTVRVDGPGQAAPLLLPPREVEAPLPNLWTGSQRCRVWRVTQPGVLPPARWAGRQTNPPRCILLDT